jgi:hypothetical protein
MVKSKILSVLILHWIINPAMAINELLLGQRVPKGLLKNNSIDKTLFGGIYLVCPHCNHLNDSRIWSLENNRAFGNWFGLYCPNCGGIIPCVRNLTAAVLIFVTSPVWIWFRNSLKKKWLAAQPARYRGIELPSDENRNKTSFTFDFIEWTIMFGFVNFVAVPVITGNRIELVNPVFEILVYIIMGLISAAVLRLAGIKRESG